MHRRIASLFAMMLAASVAVGCGSSQDAAPQEELVGTNADAAIPAPPVNQFVGLPDTVMTELVAQTCVNCHGQSVQRADGVVYPTCEDASQRCPQIADRHHQLLAEPGNTFGCTTCHGVAPGSAGGITVLVDCMACHRRTDPVTGQSISPHHGTEAAIARQCTDCHGQVVQNFDDGAYIPSSPPSMVTPGVGESQCKVRNAEGTCVAGSCTACHQAGPSQNGSPAIRSNMDTHHGTGIGFIQGTACDWCHGGTTGQVLSIRSCESCHTPASLHAIQPAPEQTMGTPGYGHVGTDQDCWGCHGFFARFDEQAPDAGPIVPTLDSVIYEKEPRAGSATLVQLSGRSFVNEVVNPDGTKTVYEPIVALTQSDDTGNIVRAVGIEFGAVTGSTVLARIPADLPAGAWDFRVAKAVGTPKQSISNKLTVVVMPKVAVAEVTASGNTVTVAGEGFGKDAPLFDNAFVGVKVDGVACPVDSWSDKQIVVSCASAPAGAAVEVITVNNPTKPLTAVVGGAQPAPAPPAPAPIPEKPAPAPTAPVASAAITAGGTTSSCSTGEECANVTARSGRNVSFNAGASKSAAKTEWSILKGKTVVKRSTNSSFSAAFASGQYVCNLLVTSADGAQAKVAIPLTVR